jgi:hypothetical protein
LNPPPFGVGSGKFDTPCERMQRAKFNASCWSWVWLELEPELPEELELLGEPEPHAAITVLARITAVAAGSLEATRDVAYGVLGRRLHRGRTRRDLAVTWRLTPVLSFTMPRWGWMIVLSPAAPWSAPTNCASTCGMTAPTRSGTASRRTAVTNGSLANGSTKSAPDPYAPGVLLGRAVVFRRCGRRFFPATGGTSP